MYPRSRQPPVRNLKLDIPLALKFSGQIHDPGININCKLVETAIKFFLFQRSQIPIPYDKIQSREKLHVVSNVNSEMMEISEDNKVELEEISLKEAIRIRRMKRKESREKRLAERKYNKMIEKEGNILSIWEPLFETLRNVCKESNSSALIQTTTTEAILLLFGPSILNPKEIIIVEYVKNQGQIERSLAKCPTAEDLVTITRSFYKNLIMSTAFTEFTDKRLRSTYSHILLLTTEPRHKGKREIDMENPTAENLTLLENPNNVLKSIILPEQNTNKRTKTLHIRLDSQFQMQSDISSTTSSNKTKSVFEANVDTLDNCFCYQVNLKYKGVLT